MITNVTLVTKIMAVCKVLLILPLPRNSWVIFTRKAVIFKIISLK